MNHAPGHPHSPFSAGLIPAGFDDLFLGRDYDANGNRDSAGYNVGTGGTLTASPNATYTYDAAGHLTAKTDTSTGKVTTFAYDHRDRLVGITRKTSGGTVDYRTTYVYDALNRRIAEQVDADGAGAGSPVTTWTVFDGENPYADFDGAGALQTRYLYSLAVDEILGRTDSSGDTYWYMTDGLGSVRDIFDEWGSSAYHTGYDSFGNKISTTGTGDRFGFTGREHDAALNLYYYRARFYDPATGRFVSKDPIGFEAGDTNLYRYVGNGPQNATDPSGALADTGDQNPNQDYRIIGGPGSAMEGAVGTKDHTKPSHATTPPSKPGLGSSFIIDVNIDPTIFDPRSGPRFRPIHVITPTQGGVGNGTGRIGVIEGGRADTGDFFPGMGGNFTPLGPHPSFGNGAVDAINNRGRTKRSPGNPPPPRFDPGTQFPHPDMTQRKKG